VIILPPEYGRPGRPDLPSQNIRATIIRDRLSLTPTQTLVALGVWHNLSEKQIAT
jgi:hypothetical protein